MLTREFAERLIARDGDHFDVIVAGGGPAGIGAALASVASGAKTLLLESKAFFGGVAAVSGWMPMNRLMLSGGSRGGVHETFVAKIKSMGNMIGVGQAAGVAAALAAQKGILPRDLDYRLIQDQLRKMKVVF